MHIHTYFLISLCNEIFAIKYSCVAFIGHHYISNKNTKMNELILIFLWEIKFYAGIPLDFSIIELY